MFVTEPRPKPAIRRAVAPLLIALAGAAPAFAQPGVSAIKITTQDGTPRAGNPVRKGETVRLELTTLAYVGTIGLGSSNPAALSLSQASVNATATNPNPSIEVTGGNVTTVTTVTITASTPSPLKSSKTATVTIYPPPTITKAEISPTKSVYQTGESVNLKLTLSYAEPIGGTQVLVQRPMWNFWGTASHFWPGYWAAGITPKHNGVGGSTDIKKATVGINSNTATIPITMAWWVKDAALANQTLLGGHDTLAYQTWTAEAKVMQWSQSSVTIPTTYPGTATATWTVQRPIQMAGFLLGNLTVHVTTNHPTAPSPIQTAVVCVGTATNPKEFGKLLVNYQGKATFTVPQGTALTLAVSAPQYDDRTATFQMGSTTHLSSIRLVANSNAVNAACT